MATRKTILVVDDTPEIAHLLREVLELDGHRVLVAPTADLGMQSLRAFRVALVLTDALYSTDAEPGDIWSGLDRLVRAAGSVPLILYAPDKPHRYAEYAAHGFAARLTKPLNLDGLLALVDSLLLAEGAAPTREG